jgi:hypothetical protein
MKRGLYMKLRTTTLTGVLIWLLVVLVGCSQHSELNQEGNSLVIHSDHHLNVRGGPAPNYLLMSITPQQQEYKQDDVVNFTITMKNVWKESLQIVNNPNILVGPATISTNQYHPIVVPDLVNKTLKPGETIVSSATWQQSGEPGLYQVQFGDIDLEDTKLSGGGSSFFVKYPAGKVQTKTIKTKAEIKLPTENGDLTFVLKSIEMNDHETKVYFEFVTDLDASMGFQISLASSNDDIHSFGIEQSQPEKGIIKGTAIFNPTTNDVSKLQIKISDWTVIYKGVRSETRKGPWTVVVPI